MVRSKTQGGRPVEALAVLAAFLFVGGLLSGSPTALLAAGLACVLAALLHVAGLARPVSRHGRKHGSAVRYSR
jgi:hypothetical protein